MDKKQTTLFQNSLIWFGAGVSLAEIITGTYLAPLGFTKGVAAILLGHVIGCILLFLSGVIGGQRRKSAMEAVKDSFGKKGGQIFAVLNVLQLAGWTAIMIYDGALAAQEIFSIGAWFWCLLIGLLIGLWILIGFENLEKLNIVAMAGLFLLTVVLCGVIFRRSIAGSPLEEAMSFGVAVELSVAMPLSWLPLISDYTREAKKPVQASAISALVYGLISCWMYLIGMGAAILTGESNVASIMVKAGLGVAGLLIIVFSTVTTTFLDAFSAGVSTVSIFNKISEKWAALVVTVLGTLSAMLFPMDDITDFLYLIGSVFAPMIAVQIADFFILKRKGSLKSWEFSRLLVWMVGFVLYRLLMRVDFVLGNTLPDMVLTATLCILIDKIIGEKLPS